MTSTTGLARPSRTRLPSLILTPSRLIQSCSTVPGTRYLYVRAGEGRKEHPEWPSGLPLVLVCPVWRGSVLRGLSPVGGVARCPEPRGWWVGRVVYRVPG